MALAVRVVHRGERADSYSSFPILTDPGCRIATGYRIAFTVAPQFRPAYVAHGYPERLKKGRDGWRLPLPATYIIDWNGIVVLSYVDGDSHHAAGADRDRRGVGASSRKSESKPAYLAVYEHSGQE